MAQPATLALCAALVGCLPNLAGAQTAVSQSKPVTTVATIEAIDPESRVVTLKGEKGNSIEVKAPDSMQGFKTLKVGDQVSATYFQAVALQIRKPGDPAPSTTPMTTTTRKDQKPGSETRRQQTVTASVEAIDPAGPSVKVKGPQGHSVTLAVPDTAQLQQLKLGDTVDVTYYESLLIKVARPPHPKS